MYFRSKMTLVFIFIFIGNANCFTATAFSSNSQDHMRLSDSLSVKAETHQLWNQELFNTSPIHSAYYKVQNAGMNTNEIRSALHAIEHFTCLRFSKMTQKIENCRDPWTICTDIKSTKDWVLASSGSGRKQLFSSTKSTLGVTASVVASLGGRSEINRADRNDYLVINFQSLRHELLLPETFASRALASQLFLKCDDVKNVHRFDYFSVSFGDNMSFQENDEPVIVTKDPANMWKLYVRMPSDPRLTVLDRYTLMERHCSTDITKDGIHCDPFACKSGFLLGSCLCVCLPGFAGEMCDQKQSTIDTSETLGIPLPDFPITISSAFSFVNDAFEMTSSSGLTQHRLVWTCQMEAPNNFRLHIALYTPHLTRHLENNSDEWNLLDFQMLHTYAGSTRYRVLRLSEHLPVAKITPRVTKVTMLLVAHGDRRLTPLIDGSPLVTQSTPDPRFHLWLARSRRSSAVMLAFFTGTSNLPITPYAPGGQGRMGGDDGGDDGGGGGGAGDGEDAGSTTKEPLLSIPGIANETLNEYLPIALGIICAICFFLLLLSIFCFLRTVRQQAAQARGGDPRAAAAGSIPAASSASDADLSSTSGSSSVSPPLTEASGAPTSDGSDATSTHVHFREPPEEDNEEDEEPRTNAGFRSNIRGGQF